ncbi:hypothetical protein HWV62_13199 [Athelia sp. TMB]|nr:hypothetical protein HWV62_13199 [Athelia sp. TMB]
MSSGFTSVELTPTPGFVVKSTTTAPFFLSHSLDATPNPKLLEPATAAPDALPAGTKVFVNIAWDAGVPAPPPGSEDAVQAAMRGDEPDEGYYVPVVVSDGRTDTDKKGARALVFDAVFNTGVKRRAMRDVEFKAFIVELALQRIEDQARTTLSRQIGTPNIASKGVLAPRTVQIPSVLFSGTVPAPPQTERKLIEEVDTAKGQPKKKSILKAAAAPPPISEDAGPTTPKWSWAQVGARIKITIVVPALTHAQIAASTLDLEPRRVLLRAPPYALDLPLDAPDAELAARSGAGGAEGALGLKRARDLDVEVARAEWRVGEGLLVVYA